MNYTFAQYRESADALQAKLGGFRPKVAMILGSGLGYLGDLVEDAVVVPYGEIPHFKHSTAPGHKGQLVFGRLAGQPVAVMQGRVHHYEGYSYEEVSYGVRVLRLLGCDTLFVTNAAGGVNWKFQAGDLMLITDHIKIFMESPLWGENIPEFGPRFPDASYLYTPRLQELARQQARRLDMDLKEGVYMYFPGPQYETPPRSAWPGFWGRTPWACPPRRRSSPPGTAAWRCWASPWSPTWPPGCCPKSSARKRCWRPPPRPGTGSPPWCWPAWST